MAGIYAHTGKHIIAAPMAHYMAMQGSRFSYSHDTCHFPIYGIDHLLRHQDMVMSFREVKGTLIPFHKAMHYSYRPPEMEGMCSYEFFQTVEIVSRTQASKITDEPFEMQDEHPCQAIMVAVYRKRECVPVFPWRWLGSTAGFSTPMNESTQEGDVDYPGKEEYAYKFMLLFLPFRTDADLRVNESYLRRWQLAYNQNEFKDEMIEVADNIQTIFNSLASTNPGESGKLSPETNLDELDDGENVNDDITEEVEIEDIMANIGGFFAGTEESNNLTEEATQIDPTYAGQFFKSQIVRDGRDAHIALNSVIPDMATDVVAVQQNALVGYKERWTTAVSQLNSLAMITRIVDSNQGEGNRINGNEVSEHNYVNANGTCQSIVLWGQNARLDPEQQCAFEILTATYVLTFYEEAHIDVIEDTDFPQRLENLKLFARRKPESGPLIMFVTGPAGAGKCKSPKQHQ